MALTGYLKLAVNTSSLNIPIKNFLTSFSSVLLTKTQFHCK